MNLKRRPTPTERAVKLKELQKRLLKLDLPSSWAALLLRRGLRPKALREAIGSLAKLREELATAQERLAGIRRRIKETLSGKSIPVSVPAPAPAPRVDDDQEDQDNQDKDVFFDEDMND